jgi:hypothetical protein
MAMLLILCWGADAIYCVYIQLAHDIWHLLSFFYPRIIVEEFATLHKSEEFESREFEVAG